MKKSEKCEKNVKKVWKMWKKFEINVINGRSEILWKKIKLIINIDKFNNEFFINFIPKKNK